MAVRLQQYPDVIDPVNPDVYDPLTALPLIKRILSHRNLAEMRVKLYAIISQRVRDDSNPRLEILINLILWGISIGLPWKMYIVMFGGGRRLISDLYYAPDRKQALQNYYALLKSLAYEQLSVEVIKYVVSQMGLPGDFLDISIEIYVGKVLSGADFVANKMAMRPTGVFIDKTPLDIQPYTSKISGAMDDWGANSGMLLDYSD